MHGLAPLVPAQEEEIKDNFRPSEDYANYALTKIKKKSVSYADCNRLKL